ncbi:MAG: hypothetical protein B7Y75_04585, partial [Azorhizobium sp. 35-67-5]
IGEDAERLRTRLRLSNAEFARLEALSGAPSVGADLDPRAARALIYGIGREAFLDRLLIACARRGGDPATLAQMATAWVAPECPFTAIDFMARGLRPGPALGAALAQAKAAWVAADFPADAVRIAALADAASPTPGGDGAVEPETTP